MGTLRASPNSGARCRLAVQFCNSHREDKLVLAVVSVLMREIRSGDGRTARRDEQRFIVDNELKHPFFYVEQFTRADRVTGRGVPTG